MGNPIQYRNTDNPSQMGGGEVCQNSEVVCHNNLSLWTPPPQVFHNGKAVVVCPVGVYHNGEINENFTPAWPFHFYLVQRNKQKHQ